MFEDTCSVFQGHLQIVWKVVAVGFRGICSVFDGLPEGYLPRVSQRFPFCPWTPQRVAEFPRHVSISARNKFSGMVAASFRSIRRAHFEMPLGYPNQSSGRISRESHIGFGIPK